jgi:hypothetical protein
MMLMSNSLNMYFKQNKSTLAFPDIEWWTTLTTADYLCPSAALPANQ